MVTAPDEKKLDVSKLKTITAGIKKICDLDKTPPRAKSKHVDLCAGLRERMQEADFEAAQRLVAVIAALLTDNPAAIATALAALMPKLVEYQTARQRWIDCLVRNNDPRKSEEDKRTKQLRDLRTQLAREQDKLDK